MNYASFPGGVFEQAAKLPLYPYVRMLRVCHIYQLSVAKLVAAAGRIWDLLLLREGHEL